MKKRGFVGMLVSLFLFVGLSAQEMADPSDGRVMPDSIAQKDTIRINQEFLDAIRNGTFIRSNPHDQQGKEADPDLSILKDFSEYLKKDTTLREEIDCLSLPPAVFSLYPFDIDTALSVRNRALTPSRSLVILPNRIHMRKIPISFTVGAANLYLEEVKDGQSQGTLGASIRYTFSMEDALRYIFWKSHRDKLRNRKRAYTWQHYNNY